MINNSCLSFSVFLFINLSIIAGCITQVDNTTNRVFTNASANTIMFLSEQNDKKKLEKEYSLITIGNEKYIGGMMLVNANYNEADAKATGLLVGAKNGNIVSVKIPINKVKEVLSLPFVQNLDVDSKISSK